MGSALSFPLDRPAADLSCVACRSPVCACVLCRSGLLLSVVATILLTVLLRRKLREELDKYQSVATSEEAEDGDDDDDFMGLGRRVSSPMGARDSAVEMHLHEHEPALSDSDGQAAVSDGGVAAVRSAPDGSESRRASDARKVLVASDVALAAVIANTRRPRSATNSLHTTPSAATASAGQHSPSHAHAHALPDLALHHTHSPPTKHVAAALRDQEEVHDSESESEALIATGHKNV